MKALSAYNYIKENKGRAFIIIFLLFLTTLMVLAGNYVDSVNYYWDRSYEYSDKMIMVTALSTDEDYKEFAAVYEDLTADEKLIVEKRSPRGYMGLPWECTMGFEMGGASMVFDTPEDMKKAFGLFGIEADLSGVTDESVVMSTALARQYGLKKDDILDEKVYEGMSGSYRIAELIDDDSYILYYCLHYEGQPLRLNILSSTLSGDELCGHIKDIVGDRKASVGQPSREMVSEQFAPFMLIFGTGIVLLSVILSVIVNSVISGQFIARTYEFGVYRAIGLSKKDIYIKIGSELFLTDLIAVAAGAILITLFSFLINELYYIPKGEFLPYYSGIGLKGFLASNLLVMIPTILLKGHSMSKSDVTEF